jgi:PEGA domain
VAAKAEIRTFVSSSGFRDGLGERVLGFDRPLGEVRERLRVRPELAAFEAALGAQIDRVSKLTDPRFPRARDVDRDRITGQVVVVSDYMPGERLSDLLEIAKERSVFPDIAAALQTAGELLLAMASFSGALKMVHGAIAPSRIVISETGDVGLTDYIFAPILPRLRFSPSRLWSDLSVAGAADGATFDEASDARQIALVLVAMALGRPIEAREYPHKIPALVAEVSDVALISGGDGLATGLRAWLERALNLEGRQGFGNLAHACASFGQLTFDGGGLAGSRSALVTFLHDVVRPPQVVEAPPPAFASGFGAASPPPAIRIVPPPAPLKPLAKIEPLPKIEPIVFATPDPEPILIPESEPIVFTFPEPEPVAAVEPEPIKVVEPERFVIPAPEPEPEPAPPAWTPVPEPVVLSKPEPAPLENFTLGPEFAPISDPEPVFTPEPVVFEPPRRESWLEPPAAPPPPESHFEFTFNVPAGPAPKPVLEPIVKDPPPVAAPPEPPGLFRALRRERRPEPEPAPLPPPAPPAPFETSFGQLPTAEPEVAHMTVLERLERLVHKLASPFPVPHSAPPPAPPPVEPPVPPAAAAPAWIEPGPPAPPPPPAVVAPEPPPVAPPAPEPSPRMIAPLPVAAPEPVAVAAPEPPPVAEPAPAPIAPPPLAPAMVPTPAPEESRDTDRKKKKPKKLKVHRREPDPQAPPPVHVTPPPPPPVPPALAYVLPDIPPPGVAPLPAPASPFPSAALPDIPPPGVVPLPPPSPIFPAMSPRTVAPPVLATPPSPPAPIRLKDPSADVVARARTRDRNVGFTARPEPQLRPPAMIEMPERPGVSLWKFAAIIVVLAVAGFAAFKFGWSSAVVAQEPGMLTVETTPTGSQVYVDDELKGKTPLTIPLTAGKHELKLTRRGLTYEKSIVVEEGKTRVERYAWSRVRPAGRGGLRVSSEPPGAKVYVDGKLQGETPLDLPNTSVGTHTVTIESSIGSVRRTVNVVRDEQALVDVELYSGFVKVFAPIELELSVNGRSVGNGSEPIMLPPGEQQILAVNKEMGYREVHTIEVDPGETRTLTITPVGRLTVTAVPYAEVWIDETKMGPTPITNRRVPIGTHTLVLRHPEHGERKVVATIKHNEVTSVPVDMTKP